MGVPPTIEVANLSMADSLILMVMALVVFGPRRLPQIGRQIGKLMYEFRKASNDFKFQMEEELRNAEDADRRRKEEEERQLRLAANPPAQIEAGALATQEALTPTETPTPATESLYPYDGVYDKLTEAQAQTGSTYPTIQPPSTGERIPADWSASEAAEAVPMQETSAAATDERTPSEKENAVIEPSVEETTHATEPARNGYPADAIEKGTEGCDAAADLPGMSLMEHLEELRKRIVHSAIYLAVGFFVAYAFHERLYGFVQAPLDKLHIKLNYTHPMDPLNLYLQVALIGGAILAAPFILYQVWLFIAPGLYQKEKRFVIPFMSATVGLFLAGASFGYFFVLPGALKILILGFGSKFNPIVTIEEYTGFFLSIILGLGVSFELPILIFFLALFGIVSPRFLWKNIRYAILAVFLVSAVICPSPDPGTMCIYAVPMLALYVLGIGVAWWVHPGRRKAKEAKEPAS